MADYGELKYRLTRVTLSKHPDPRYLLVQLNSNEILAPPEGCFRILHEPAQHRTICGVDPLYGGRTRLHQVVSPELVVERIVKILGP